MGAIIPEELTALGLSGSEELDAVLARVEHVSADVRPGSRSAYLLVSEFGAAIERTFGLRMVPASLNLWTEVPLCLPDPVVLDGANGRAGYVTPVILDDAALGFVLRVVEGQSSTFLEVFGHTWFKKRLDLQDGDNVCVSLVPKHVLRRFASTGPRTASGVLPVSFP